MIAIKPTQTLSQGLPVFLAVLIFLSACNNSTDKTSDSNPSDTLTEAQKHLASNALRGLHVYAGLEVEIMATEPMLKNPTNIDVDERGRVWVTEAYNYRPILMATHQPGR
jgi:hypothetical protein